VIKSPAQAGETSPETSKKPQLGGELTRKERDLDDRKEGGRTTDGLLLKRGRTRRRVDSTC